MDTNIAVNEQIGWRFGLRWVLLTIAGLVIGLPAGLALVEVTGGVLGIHNDSVFCKLGLDNAAAFICLCAAVGLMQWFTLRRVVQRAGFWVPANIIGFTVSSCLHGIACYVLRYPDDLGVPRGALMWAAAFVLGGTLTGLLQQRILRHQVRRSGWWVPASAAGWGLSIGGLGVYFLLFSVVKNGPVISKLIGNLLVPMLIPSAILGVITAGVLIWLLRQPIEQTPIQQISNN
jgi:hypothetical protein